MTEPSSTCSSAPSAVQATKASSPAQRSSRRAMRFRTVKAGEKIVLLLARQGEVARLHMAKAADLLGDRRDLDRYRVIGRRELCEQAIDVRFVFRDQRALGAPLRGVTKHVEWRTAQTAQAFQHMEHRQHPGAEAHLARLAGGWILARNKRWREMEHELVIALEHAGDLLLERAVGVQPRDLVFVLVGEQLGVVARDRFAQLGRARRFALALAHALNQLAIALGIGRVLVRGEELDATLDQLVQRAREMFAQSDDLGRQREALDALQVDGGTPAPEEALLVELDRDAVQLDGALERGAGNRNPALLVGIAEHQHVGGNGIAHQTGRELR